MRKRICMALVASSSDRTKVYRRTNDQLAKSKRRAEFEKNYLVKKQFVTVGIKPTSELIEFNNNIAKQIKQFKQSR
jgi:hypothetical protein